MFLKRNYQPEIMDNFSIQDERIDDALKELKIINRYLGGISVSKTGLKKSLKQISAKQNLKILDVGSGASDVLLTLAKDNCNVKIFCIDKNKRACNYARDSIPGLKIACGDAFTFPFRKKEFNIIHASLFLHHFTEEEIKRLLVEFIESASHALIINDLRRSVFALAGIKLLTSMFSKSDFVKNDGPLSVKRGFIKSELIEILNAIPISNFEIIRKWAFRWLIIIYVNKN